MGWLADSIAKATKIVAGWTDGERAAYRVGEYADSSIEKDSAILPKPDWNGKSDPIADIERFHKMVRNQEKEYWKIMEEALKETE